MFKNRESKAGKIKFECIYSTASSSFPMKSEYPAAYAILKLEHPIHVRTLIFKNMGSSFACVFVSDDDALFQNDCSGLNFDQLLVERKIYQLIPVTQLCSLEQYSKGHPKAFKPKVFKENEVTPRHIINDNFFIKYLILCISGHNDGEIRNGCGMNAPTIFGYKKIID
jgi:hypothetical protein